MNFLPIAHLEMRAAARKPMTYYSRCLSALVAVSAGIGFFLAGFTRMMSTASAGQAIFGLLAASAYVLLAAQSILLTYDCISLEKREGTLGLLFLTDLNGFDIVTGKLAAQVSRCFYCLVAAFPAFGFCILLGGVGLGDFAEVALGLLNTLFYFSALGILISACVWRERVAAAWGGLALLVLGALLPAAAFILNWPALLPLVPAGAVMTAFNPAAPHPNMGISLVLPHALGWLFVVAASFVVPRSWTRAPNIATRRAKNPSTASPPWMRDAARPLLITALLALICVVAAGAALVGPAWLRLPPDLFAILILLLHGVLKFQAASQAGRVLAAKRRNGELELLLTTPYDEDDILRGCLLGVKRSLLWPTLFVLSVDIVLLILGWWRLGWGDGFSWAVVVVVEMIWLLGSLYGLSWVALYLGLRLASPAKATGRAIFYVVLLPWVLMVFFAVMAMPLGHGFGPEFTVFCLGAFILSVLFCNLFFTGWAISEMRDHFRALAART